MAQGNDTAGKHKQNDKIPSADHGPGLLDAAPKLTSFSSVNAGCVCVGGGEGGKGGGSHRPPGKLPGCINGVVQCANRASSFSMQDNVLSGFQLAAAGPHTCMLYTALAHAHNLVCRCSAQSTLTVLNACMHSYDIGCCNTAMTSAVI